MNEYKMFGAFTSSADPTKISRTVEGIMQTAVAALVLFGVLNTTDGQSLLEQAGVIVSAGVTIWGAIETVRGILRKILVFFAQRR